jgi:hypothetical protein
MKLQPQIKNECGVFITQFVRIGDQAEQVESLASFVFGNLTTLAGQIDLLRAELVAKGIDVAT